MECFIVAWFGKFTVYNEVTAMHARMMYTALDAGIYDSLQIPFNSLYDLIKLIQSAYLTISKLTKPDKTIQTLTKPYHNLAET